jgi:EAL domain-containing protein (putative c-di-GMP-specific phosphodiesterase class I)/GGDEF domain-containing protein
MPHPVMPLDSAPDHTLSLVRPADRLDQDFHHSLALLAFALLEVAAVAVQVLDEAGRWFICAPGMPAFTGDFLDAALGDYPRQGAAAREIGARHDADGVSPMRFSARAPLLAADGALLGWVWLIDKRPRFDFQEKEKALLAHIAQALSDKVEMSLQLRYQDRLTGLGNRTQFMRDIRARLIGANDTDWPVYAVMIDVFSLKYISRLVVATGLSAVERAIQLMQERLACVLPRNIELYRLGLARFGFLHAGDQETVRALAARCVARFDKPLAIDETALPLSVSAYAGVMRVESDVNLSEVIGGLFVSADQAREAGKMWAVDDRVWIYDKSLMQAQQRTFQIVNSLRGALLASDQLRLVYQPRERLCDGAWISVEALLRWRHPTLGDIAPVEFIPAVEATSLMSMLTDWVVDRALGQLAVWLQSAPSFAMSVNISASDLTRPDFVPMLSRAMMRHGIQGGNLELEVTESALAHDVQAARCTLEQLAVLGVSVAVDDFGSGYSNLAQLHALPFDVLKIDNALVRAALTNRRAEEIIKSVVGLAKALDHRIIAEGIETAELRAMAVGWDCDEVQGYFISRPMESAAMSAWFAAQ